MRRVLAALTLAVAAATLAAPVVRAAPPAVVLQDLDGRAINPFVAAEDAPAIVFLFTSVECPISNRYAPEVQRLHAEYAAKGVAFWMVYPNPSDQPAAIREHLNAFSYPAHALRDPNHLLVKLANATVTPEAAVFDRHQALTYHGRIDDRYVALGIERPAPSVHDLGDALAATLRGETPRAAAAPAVGCYIADFVS